MVLRKKPNSDSEPEDDDNLRAQIERELQRPKVQAVVHYVKHEFPADVAFFSELVHTRPADAVSTLIWKHHAYMQMRHEIKLRSIMRAEYEELSPAAKARVDSELAKHPPAERDRAFVVVMIVEKLREKGIDVGDNPKEGISPV